MTEFSVDVARTIAAPREKVYRAFLDPALLQRWMSPPGYEGLRATVDERVGGRLRVEFRDADGGTHGFAATIRDLVQHERIVMDFTFEGLERQMNEETLLTVTLRDAEGGGTEVRLVNERITLAPPFTTESVDAGWNGALDKLEALYERS